MSISSYVRNILKEQSDFDSKMKQIQVAKRCSDKSRRKLTKWITALAPHIPDSRIEIATKIYNDLVEMKYDFEKEMSYLRTFVKKEDQPKTEELERIIKRTAAVTGNSAVEIASQICNLIIKGENIEQILCDPKIENRFSSVMAPNHKMDPPDQSTTEVQPGNSEPE